MEMTIRGTPISDFSFEVFQGSGAFYMRRESATIVVLGHV